MGLSGIDILVFVAFYGLVLTVSLWKSRGRRTKGMVSGWRKAVVTIADGDKIELFEAI